MTFEQQGGMMKASLGPVNRQGYAIPHLTGYSIEGDRRISLIQEELLGNHLTQDTRSVQALLVNFLCFAGVNLGGRR